MGVGVGATSSFHSVKLCRFCIFLAEKFRKSMRVKKYKDRGHQEQDLTVCVLGLPWFNKKSNAKIQ